MERTGEKKLMYRMVVTLHDTLGINGRMSRQMGNYKIVGLPYSMKPDEKMVPKQLQIHNAKIMRP